MKRRCRHGSAGLAVGVPHALCVAADRSDSGEVNAFLIAMALDLGMLDLAYMIEQVVAALPKR